MNHLKQLIKDTQEKPNASCAKRSSLEKNESKQKSIMASVVFGMPAKDCSYNGICRIDHADMYNQYSAGCISIAEIFRVGKKHFLFRFSKNKMRKLTIRKHFGSGYFIVLEDYETPEFIGTTLGQCAPVIRQGIYPVLDKDDYFEVLF